MSVQVRIPTQLRQLVGGASIVEADGSTVGEALADLERRFPGVSHRLVDESGSLRRFVNIYVGDEDVRFHDGLSTPLIDGAQVSIIPAVAGG